MLEVADWAASVGFEALEIACWPRATGPTRRYAGTSHIDVANLSPAQGKEIVDALSRKKSPSPRWAIIRIRSRQTRRTAEPSSDHLKKVIVAAGHMSVPLVNTFCGGDASKTRRRQLGGGSEGLAGNH